MHKVLHFGRPQQQIPHKIIEETVATHLLLFLHIEHHTEILVRFRRIVIKFSKNVSFNVI